MARITDDQKRQIEEAQRARYHMNLTWNLYQMFLGNPDCKPLDALHRAIDSVEVWKEFEENNRIEMPEVHYEMVEGVPGTGSPDSGLNAMVGAVKEMMGLLKQQQERKELESRGGMDEGEEFTCSDCGSVFNTRIAFNNYTCQSEEGEEFERRQKEG